MSSSSGSFKKTNLSGSHGPASLVPITVEFEIMDKDLKEEKDAEFVAITQSNPGDMYPNSKSLGAIRFHVDLADPTQAFIRMTFTDLGINSAVPAFLLQRVHKYIKDKELNVRSLHARWQKGGEDAEDAEYAFEQALFKSKMTGLSGVLNGRSVEEEQLTLDLEESEE